MDVSKPINPYNSYNKLVMKASGAKKIGNSALASGKKTKRWANEKLLRLAKK